MKRVVLAGSVCLLASLPAHALDPDVNLSGTFASSLSWFQDNNVLNKLTDLDLENNGSNFRITAAAQEGGIRAFMAYERGASNDQLGVEDVREFFGGVSGFLGTALLGRKATDYRQAGERLDPFYNTSVSGTSANFASEGASYGLSNLTNGYTSNTIAYHSPVFSGFDVNGAVFVNDNNNQGAGDKPDLAGGVGYANSDWLGLDAGVQVLDINGNVVAGSPAGDSTAWRVHGSIGQNLWAAGASYELVNVKAEPSARQYAFVSGSYQVLEWMRVAASYGHDANTPSFDGNGFSLGAFYDVTKNLSTYTALRYVKLDNGNQDETFTVAGGLKFVFDVDL